MLLLLQVPSDQVSSTPVQLMATAGLRMLSNGSAEAVMAEVRAGITLCVPLLLSHAIFNQWKCSVATAMQRQTWQGRCKSAL
jgi:hypothetical protein